MYLFAIFIIAIPVNSQLTHYCKEKSSLITTDEIEDYVLVDVEINSTVVMECHFCKSLDSNSHPKIWYWQDRQQLLPEKEVLIGISNNSSLNRIRTNPEMSLVIKSVENSDAGIYKCHGEEGQGAENKFNYKLETVFKEKSVIAPEKGNITDWENYRELQLKPVTMRFAVSKMKEIAEIRRSGVILEVVSEWSSWGSCGNCVNGKGFRNSVSLCRLKRRINNTNDENSEIYKFFQTVPILPCRAIVLEEKFPGVSKAVRFLPSFILMEGCTKCPKIDKKKSKFKYKKKHVLLQGTHLVSTCPDANVESQVIWKKDGLTLKKGTEQSFRKKDPNAKIIVDAFSTLYLMDVSKNEDGNYTCYVDGANTMTLKVIIVSKSRLLTDAFFRHSGYLAFILFLTSFCYCAGLSAAYQRKHEFKMLSDENLENEEKEPLIEIGE